MIREPISYLPPEELRQTKHVTTVIAQAEQANEHDEKQGDVGNKHGNEGGFAGLCLQRHTAATCRYPSRAKLLSDKPRKPKTIKIETLTRTAPGAKSC